MGHAALRLFGIAVGCFQAGELQRGSRASPPGCCLSEQEKGSPVSGYLEILAWLESKFNGMFLWPVSSSL